MYLHKPTVVIGCSTSSWIFLLIDSFVVVKRSSLGIEPFHLLVLILIVCNLIKVHVLEFVLNFFLISAKIRGCSKE